MLPKTTSYAVLTGLLLYLLLFSGAVSAKDCKGMSKSACSSSDSCTWVKGYTTKKDVTVEAYCRNKGKKSAASKNSGQATTAKKSDKPDNKDVKSESEKSKKTTKQSNKEDARSSKKDKKSSSKDSKAKTKEKKSGTTDKEKK